MAWYFHLALRQLFPRGKAPSSFCLSAVAGVALGVMLLLIVQSVMGGFGQIYRELIVATSGHLRVESGAIMYEDEWRGTVELLNEREDVAAVEPYAHGILMLQHRNRPAFPKVRSIGLGEGQDVIQLEEFLVSGALEDLDEDSVLLSSILSRQLGAWVGSVVEVYTPLMIEALRDEEVILPRELRVAGIYETGWNDFDSNTMLVSLGLMQDLYGLRNGIHGVAVRLEEGTLEKRFAEALNEELPPPQRAFIWEELFEDFLFVLALEKNVMFFLLLFIVLVAAFAIAMVQALMVVRRTREIGLVGALGGSPGALALGYCLQGAIIGVVGTGLGMGLGVLALSFRNPIILWISDLTGTRETLIQFYQFANLPVDYSVTDFTLIGSFAILLVTLAGVIPAWQAATMRPAEALRSE